MTAALLHHHRFANALRRDPNPQHHPPFNAGAARRFRIFRPHIRQ
jgi:hypothetical protein